MKNDQPLKTTIINYFGAAVGALSTFLVYPLAIEAHGLINFLKVTALMLLPIATFGMQNLVVRFYPSYREHRAEFFTFIMGGSMVLMLVFAFTMIICGETVFDAYSKLKSATGVDRSYLWYSIPLVMLIGWANILSGYLTNENKVATPTVLYGIVIKFSMPLIILSVYFGWLDLDGAILAYMAAMALVVTMMLMYASRINMLNIKVPMVSTFNNWKPMLGYMIVGVVGSLGGTLLLYLDVFMVGSMTDLENTGIYANSIMIAAAIMIPMDATISSVGPMIAAKWQSNDTGGIQKLYKSTSKNLLLVGSFLYIMLDRNMPDIISLLPDKLGDKLDAGASVVTIIGIGMLFNMATSLNSAIIQYSVKYKVNLYITIGTGIINMTLNYNLIPMYGTTGAALSTLLSVLIYNASRAAYVKYAFGMQPFTKYTIIIIIMTIGCWVFGYALDVGYPIFNGVLRVSIISIVYLLVAYKIDSVPVGISSLLQRKN